MKARPHTLYEIKARVVAALAHPKRLAIIDILGEGERTVSELAALLELSQATMSQHLSVMRRAAIVTTRREGNFIFYRIADARIVTACRAMDDAVVHVLVAEEERLRPVLGAHAQARGAG